MLCDDLQSELDQTRTGLLVEVLLAQGHQIFVTGTEAPPTTDRYSQRVFHVEQGVISFQS